MNSLMCKVFGATCLVCVYLILRLDNKLYSLKTSYAIERAQSATDARVRLENAMRRSDTAERQFIAVKTQLNLTLRERQNEIKNAATGHQCLNADLVGVLNHANAKPNISPLSTPAGVPITAGGASTAAGAIGLSDAEVAAWINAAQAQHNECRARVQSLINWHREGPK